MYATYVLAGVAANPASPEDLLIDLGGVTEYFTVLALASNPKTPCATLERLSASGEGESRTTAGRMLMQRCAAK